MVRLHLIDSGNHHSAQNATIEAITANEKRAYALIGIAGVIEPLPGGFITPVEPVHPTSSFEFPAGPDHAGGYTVCAQ